MGEREESIFTQDTYTKLIELLNSIVGWQLESSTWLRKNLVVKDSSLGGAFLERVFPSRGIIVLLYCVSLFPDTSFDCQCHTCALVHVAAQRANRPQSPHAV